MDQFVFRAYLRTHGDVVAKSVQLKKHLAEEYAKTNQLDREGKTEFVARVLARFEKDANKGS